MKINSKVNTMVKEGQLMPKGLNSRHIRFRCYDLKIKIEDNQRRYV